MATALNLTQAAGQAFDNLFGLWVAGSNQLKTSVAGFVDDLLPVFLDQDVTGRPLADWLILLDSQADLMPTVSVTLPPTTVDYQFLVDCADHVYRMCWLGSLSTGTSPRITPAQSAAILTAYNANF